MSDFSDVILNNLLDGVLIVDTNGKIVYANKAVEQLFDKSADLLVGEHLGFPIGTYEVQELEVVRNGRSAIIQMLVTQVKWKNVDAFLLSMREITRLKEITKQLEDQKSRLEKSNAELQQYASLASHDLKEPIRKILVMNERLSSNLSRRSEDEIQQELKNISKAAERLRSLISGIAEYSAVSQVVVRFEEVDLNKVLHDVIGDLDLLIEEKNAQIVFENLPTVEAICIQMHQLFLNIISNSLKYSRKDVSPVISVSAEEQDDNVLIRIKDNGIGFDNRHAQRVFQPFLRLDTKSREGSGIGLAICKKIIDLHSGSIEVKSIIGDGSEFIFTLPRQQLDYLLNKM